MKRHLTAYPASIMLALLVIGPAAAFDTPSSPGMMLYINLPIERPVAADRGPVIGLRLGETLHHENPVAIGVYRDERMDDVEALDLRFRRAERGGLLINGSELQALRGGGL